MMKILNNTITTYQYLFEELPDPRAKDWLFVSKPYQVLTILTLYTLFVMKWGPKWMKNRSPFNLKKILIAYNGIQVLICFYVFIIGAKLYSKMKWYCEPVDLSLSERAKEEAVIFYIYFALKIIDLLDTVFFILRKKASQITFLHLYHHFGMVLFGWVSTTYLIGGHGIVVPTINSFVHTAMYFYYMLNVAYPPIRESVWFKKRITQLQIIQFLYGFIHMGSLYLVPDCQYPTWTAQILIPQNLLMLCLFLNFYVKAYVKKPKTNKVSEVDENQNTIKKQKIK